MLLFTCLSALAAPPSVTLPNRDDVAERIAAYLAPFDADGQLSGTVLVARGDEVLFEQAYGMANYEHGVPNRPDTPHGIASITKAMTDVICLRLLDAGELDVGDTIDRWLPDFPRADRITVEHLLRHRAGIPHRVTTELEETVPRTAADMAALAGRALADESAFLCEPGAVSNYSSAGYSVLARVLELAGGKPYAALLHKHVCEPARLEHTLHLSHRDVLPGRAQGYMPVAGGVRNAPLKDSSFLVGAGSAYSTPRDLYRLAWAIRDGTLGPSVRASLFDAQGFTANGAGTGCRAFVDLSADTDVTVAVTANLTTGALDRLRAALPRIVAGEEVAPPERLAVETAPVPPAALERYAGTYRPRPGSTFLARVEAGDLIVGSYLLVPIGEHRFFSFQDYAEVTFALDEDGRPTQLDWNGYVMPRVDAP